MKEIDQLVRPNILALKAYSSARDEHNSDEGVFLDANESPFGKLNRYPDPLQKKLKEKLAIIKQVAPENVFIGNGSDEAIDLLIRIFCRPGKDKIILCPPTYGMYEVLANINAVEIINIPLTNNFQLNVPGISDVILENDQSEIKMIFLCSPNNPTGNILMDVETILKTFNGIVVVDEAYIDFSGTKSFAAKLGNYSNLVVLQTFSKAWGLAAARVGIAFASNKIISLMNKVKPPYNVSALNQEAAIRTLENKTQFDEQKELILAQKKYLISEFLKLNYVTKIHPSDANFVLIEVKNADALYAYLIGKKIITRNRNAVVKNCIRITVGNSLENQVLINELEKY
jgi:histidinol-phosphate aminotransferase